MFRDYVPPMPWFVLYLKFCTAFLLLTTNIDRHFHLRENLKSHITFIIHVLLFKFEIKGKIKVADWYAFFIYRRHETKPFAGSSLLSRWERRLSLRHLLQQTFIAGLIRAGVSIFPRDKILWDESARRCSSDVDRDRTSICEPTYNWSRAQEFTYS
jgi:hypothetical protein